ncbi:uncharacterized protein BJX67DRAFT_260776 [Aspergillus lucknowensis]|uniref:Uncharacterized protein n=1 Tax=Aspergillus lucknowensis TaxID=176173 RepID=A0ABR4LG40_9EURO
MAKFYEVVPEAKKIDEGARRKEPWMTTLEPLEQDKVEQIITMKNQQVFNTLGIGHPPSSMSVVCLKYRQVSRQSPLRCISWPQLSLCRPPAVRSVFFLRNVRDALEGLERRPFGNSSDFSPCRGRFDPKQIEYLYNPVIRHWFVRPKIRKTYCWAIPLTRLWDQLSW